MTTTACRPAISRCRTTFTPGYELPSTGGMGTAPFGVLGGALAAAAALLLVRKRKQNEEE